MAQVDSNGPKRPRAYQTELLQKAIDKNIIVFLGTGTGKTFIATLLIKELGNQITENGKVTVFLVPAVSLAEQQCQFLKDTLPFKVQSFTGNDNIDNWSESEWKMALKGVQVFVMVHDVFLAARQRALLPWGQINLVIFDECHHASKNHPYARILLDLKAFKKSMTTMGDPVPRVLGLSASIVSSHVTEIKFQIKKKELEDLMEAEVATIEDLGKYLQYMTSPDEEFVLFDDPQAIELIWNEKDFLDELQRVLNIQSKETAKIADEIERKIADIENNKTFKKTKNLVSTPLQVLDDIGIYGGSKVFDTLLEDIIGSKLESVDNTFEESLLRVAENHVKNMKHKVADVLSRSPLDGLQKIRHFSSSKVNVLLDKMSDFVLDNAQQSDVSHNISAIIFVKERVCTSILRYVLREAFAHMPHLSNLKVDLAVGGQTSFNFKTMGQELSPKMIQESQKLRQTLAKFAGGQIQVMVSTSVLEEGIDIRQCNFVVRFEPPMNLRQYIQSKGRARAKPSKYILMARRSDFSIFSQKIKSYRALEKMQISTCHHLDSLPDTPCRNPKVYYSDPHNPDTSPKITEMEAISLVYQYIQKLPCDRFTTLIPYWESKTETLGVLGGARQLLFNGLGMSEERIETKYFYVLHMPHLSPIRKPIEGPRNRDEASAKRQCALKAVEMLHQMGELTYRLTPRENDPDDSDDDESSIGPKIGTNKSKKYYKKHSWDAFNSLDMSQGNSYLYKMTLQLVEPISHEDNDKDYELYHPEDQPRKVGVILGQPLPEVGLTKFFLHNYSGKILVQFQCVGEITLTEEPDLLCQMKFFHAHVCRDTLKMVPSWFDYLEGKNPHFLIVPLMGDALDKALLNDILTKDEFDYPDPVVKPLHRDIGHFMVEKVLRNLSPSSPLENNAQETFASYYTNTYGCTIKDQSQPLYRVSNADARHDFRFPFPRKKSAPASRRKNAFLLIPELTKVQPIPASLWRELQLLPFALYRVQSFMQAQGLGDILARMMSTTKFQMAKNSIFDFTLTRPEFGALICGLKEDDGSSKDIPSLMELIEPLTFSSCRETFDLERLEILGDGFLKYATSIFIFFKNDQILQEGSLTALRTKVISNKNLYRRAMAIQLAKFVSPEIFEPHRNWNPPGFADTVGVEKLICDWDEEDRLASAPRSYSLFDAISLEDVADLAKKLRIQGQIDSIEKSRIIKKAKEKMGEAKAKNSAPQSNGRTLIRPREYHLIGDKSLADCMEALIGCFLAHCGPKMALRAMLALGIDLSNSDRDFNEWFTPPSNAFHEDLSILDQDEKFLKLVGSAQLAMVEKKIGYKFKEKSWLLQALTHCSYNSNNFTDSYERLEFLGDAVLDYLVTCHLVSKYPDKDPGEITILRSALVCNNTLAKVTVQNEIHKFLLQSSPQIFRKIYDYANYSLNELKEIHQHDPAKITVSNLDLLNEYNCPVLEDVEIPKVLGDVLEALIGAVYIDSEFNLPLVWNMIQRLFPEMDRVVTLKPQSPVKVLMEKFPERVKFRSLPKLGRGINRTAMVVEILETKVPPEGNRVPPKVVGTFKGIGPNKRMAKETASRCCLREIQLRNLTL